MVGVLQVIEPIALSVHKKYKGPDIERYERVFSRNFDHKIKRMRFCLLKANSLYSGDFRIAIMNT